MRPQIAGKGFSFLIRSRASPLSPSRNKRIKPGISIPKGQPGKQVVFEGFEEQAGVGHEILTESREEGIEISSLKVLEIVGDDNGFVRGVKCQKLDIVEVKEGLRLEPSKDEPVILEAQTVVIAGQKRPNDFLKHYMPQLKWDEDGSLWADAQTGMTSVEKVFGCGSVVTNGGSVVDAIAGGKAAAQKIIQYLGQS